MMRQDLMDYAFDDWKRIMRNGLTAKEARETVENDYELTEAERLKLSTRMLDELESRTESVK